ncbi:hypothetical protein L2K20_21505 [Mycobacterium sp. MBM]|nr:hypothetical protein [Mycobacterium sp. MBM]
MPAPLRLSFRLPPLPAPFPAPARLVAVALVGQAPVVPVRRAEPVVLVRQVLAVPVELVLVELAVLVVPAELVARVVLVELVLVGPAVRVEPAVLVLVGPARVVLVVRALLLPLVHPSRVAHLSVRRSSMPRALRVAPRPESWTPRARRSRVPQVMVRRSRMRRLMSARAVSRVPAEARVPAAVVRRVAAWFIPRARMSGPPVRRPARSSMQLQWSRRQLMRAFPRRQSLMALRLLPRPLRR